MDHRFLHLVVQLLGLIDTTVHDHVQEDDEGDDDEEGKGKVGIQETYKGNLDKLFSFKLNIEVYIEPGRTRGITSGR